MKNVTKKELTEQVERLTELIKLFDYQKKETIQNIVNESDNLLNRIRVEKELSQITTKAKA